MAFKVTALAAPTSDLTAALEAAGLPTDDLHEAGRRFYRFEDDRGLIGHGGLEHAGPVILIRSIAVIDGRRNAGLGAVILSRLEAEAARLQATGLYLLTTSATAYFQRHGYAVLPRSAAPPAIAASRQFSTLCPASATFMFKELPTQ